MFDLLEYTELFLNIGFYTTFVVNILFIYITGFHIKKITGTYRVLTITFSLVGLCYAGLEVIIKPFIHNYNISFLYFSVSSYPKHIIQVALAAHAGFYGVLFSFIAALFTFRYVSLFRTGMAKKVKGAWCLVWISYPLSVGVVFAVCIWLFGYPDEYSDDFLREEVLTVYNLTIENVAHFTVIPYAADWSLRWWNLSFLNSLNSIIGIQYSIVIFCSYKMHKSLKQQLESISTAHRQLQKQFFTALVAQTICPSVFLLLPASFVLLVPFFNIEISFKAGVFYGFFSLYAPMDSIVFMVIVSEYRQIIKKSIRKFLRRALISDVSIELPNLPTVASADSRIRSVAF